MATTRRLIRGIGINDADYPVRTATGVCPYYSRWSSILQRCYDPLWHGQYPSYKGCSIADDWKLFSCFSAWMKTQDWVGKVLDKDILVAGNKVYAPEFCAFVLPETNALLTLREAKRGELPIGVQLHRSKYKARGRCVVTGKQRYLGIYATAGEANLAWVQFKQVQSVLLANKETDIRVVNALINKDWRSIK